MPTSDDGIEPGIGTGNGGPRGPTDDGRRTAAGDEDRERKLYTIRAPEPESDGLAGIVRRLVKAAADLLDWVITRFTSPAAMSAVLALLAYCYATRGAVRLLPFDGGKDDGTALAVQLGQMLDAVDRGARAGVDEGLDGFKFTTVKPPDVPVPGTGVSLAPLVTWGETQVRGRVVDQNGGHRVRLQVSGPVSGLIETGLHGTVDEAIVEAAERLYALIVPVNGAYYYFSRYPDRALEVLERPLDGGDAGAAAYRAWGLALRNLGDTDGALEAFHRADAVTRDPKEHARLNVEMGYAARAARRWDAAVGYFDRAATEDPTWPVPVVRKADALRDRGDLDAALAAYESGGTAKPSFADAWVGAGHVEAMRGHTDLAMVAYETARRYASDPTQRASLLRDEGDVLFESGCTDQAARAYVDAMALRASYESDRGRRAGGACPSDVRTRSADVARCFAWEPTGEAGS